MSVFGGNPKDEPMHYGEVYGVWSFLLSAKMALSEYQTLLNHAGDKDLRKFIQELADSVKGTEISQMEELLKENGIELPPSPSERPDVDPESIPDGARFKDPEIAAGIATNISASLIACSQVMATSMREDVGAMFGQFHMKNAQQGLSILRLIKEKGWVLTPPLHRAKVEARV